MWNTLRRSRGNTKVWKESEKRSFFGRTCATWGTTGATMQRWSRDKIRSVGLISSIMWSSTWRSCVVTRLEPKQSFHDCFNVFHLGVVQNLQVFERMIHFCGDENVDTTPMNLFWKAKRLEFHAGGGIDFLELYNPGDRTNMWDYHLWRKSDSITVFPFISSVKACRVLHLDFLDVFATNAFFVVAIRLFSGDSAAISETVSLINMKIAYSLHKIVNHKDVKWKFYN